MQSVLKIGSALEKMVGQEEVDGCAHLGDSAWWLLQLPVEKPWSVPGGLTIKSSLMSECG